jgi:hypothetical protein
MTPESNTYGVESDGGSSLISIPSRRLRQDKRRRRVPPKESVPELGLY